MLSDAAGLPQLVIDLLLTCATVIQSQCTDAKISVSSCTGYQPLAYENASDMQALCTKPDAVTPHETHSQQSDIIAWVSQQYLQVFNLLLVICWLTDLAQVWGKLQACDATPGLQQMSQGCSVSRLTPCLTAFHTRTYSKRCIHK